MAKSIAAAPPPASVSLPKIAASKKIGKKLLMKPEAPAMNVSV